MQMYFKRYITFGALTRMFARYKVHIMKVSGFSFIRNAIIYDYPIIESIQSLLPLVDEYVIAVGKSDDNTKDIVESINSDKIKIIDTVWDESIRQGGYVLAAETDKAFGEVSRD